MLTIGCHLSSAKGYTAGKGGRRKSMPIPFSFLPETRAARAKEINPEDVKIFHKKAKEQGIAQILAHAPYTLNACSADESVREFA